MGRKGQEERSAPWRLRRGSEMQWAECSTPKEIRVLAQPLLNVRLLCALGQVTCPLCDSLCSSVY